MNISILVPIPKNTRKSLNNSDNYRAIALSSIAGNLLDKIILNKCSNAFFTLDQQFGFKKHHSTTQCTCVVDEVITYYNTNAACAKAALLDASKAFDRVEYVKLFRLLFKRDLCPLILRCILNMYVKQIICVKWMNTLTDSVNISNGVEQGGVLSPILCTVYLDELLPRLRESQMGCHIGNVFCGALSYADDIILLAPSFTSLNCMLLNGERFTKEYEKVFKTSKSKLILFPDLGNTKVIIPFMGGTIEHVADHSHLGCIIGAESDRQNIERTISYLYTKLNVLVRDLSYVNFDIKYLLMKTYCMPVYCSTLWELDSNCIDMFYVAWRKSIR